MFIHVSHTYTHTRAHTPFTERGPRSGLCLSMHGTVQGVLEHCVRSSLCPWLKLSFDEFTRHTIPESSTHVRNSRVGGETRSSSLICPQLRVPCGSDAAGASAEGPRQAAATAVGGNSRQSSVVIVTRSPGRDLQASESSRFWSSVGL